MKGPQNDRTYFIETMRLEAVYVVRHGSGAIACILDNEEAAVRYADSNAKQMFEVEPWVVCRLVDGKPVPIKKS